MTPAIVDLPTRDIELEDRTVEVRVRSSSTARTTRVLLGPERPLEIIVPAGASDDHIAAVLFDRRDWIAAKLADVESRRAQPFTLGLQRDDIGWLAASAIPLQVRRANSSTAALRDSRLIVTGPDDCECTAALTRWYRRQAKRTIAAVVDEHASRLDLAYRSVSVRDQRTRWGSCSAAGNLSFNWRLVIAPTDVLTYVVVHELCHLAVPNHAKAFWRQLGAALPDWKNQAGWLAEHGGELRAYEPRGCLGTGEATDSSSPDVESPA